MNLIESDKHIITVHSVMVTTPSLTDKLSNNY